MKDIRKMVVRHGTGRGVGGWVSFVLDEPSNYTSWLVYMELGRFCQKTAKTWHPAGPTQPNGSQDWQVYPTTEASSLRISSSEDVSRRSTRTNPGRSRLEEVSQIARVINSWLPNRTMLN